LIDLPDLEPVWELFHLEVHPRELLARARPILMDGLQRRLAPPLAATRRAESPWAIERLVRLDGYEAVAMQQGWGLFNPTRRPAASIWAVEILRRKGVVERCRSALAAALHAAGAAWPQARGAEAIDLVVVPGDPANRNFMTRTHGLSVAARSPGLVLVQVWPSAGNLERLPAAMARAAAHQVLAPRLDLAEQLNCESAADRIGHTLGVCRAQQLWREVLAAPCDHEAALEHAAALSGAPSYAALDTNIYGHTDQAVSTRVEPWTVEPLDEEERSYTVAVLAQMLEAAVSDSATIAGALFGDDAMRAWGHRGAGFASLAGFQVAALRPDWGSSST
jgi:hypothetical protein